MENHLDEMNETILLSKPFSGVCGCVGGGGDSEKGETSGLLGGWTMLRSAAELLAGQGQRVDVPACAGTACVWWPPTEKNGKRISAESFFMFPKQLSWSRNWTEFWGVGVGGEVGEENFPFIFLCKWTSNQGPSLFPDHSSLIFKMLFTEGFHYLHLNHFVRI